MRPVAVTLIVGLLACLANPVGLFSAEPTCSSRRSLGRGPPASRLMNDSIGWNCNSN